ncbi:hypothetical protein ACFWIQ_33620 [Kitasatospora sp. NPDC127059]|uniref:hypothetical protein n=1 Tax=unclassified Kitasatospora TaxID=2633591 RepID=UPI00365F0CF2
MSSPATGCCGCGHHGSGLRPRLLIADGLLGDPNGSGYDGGHDRLIATCAVRYLPPSWLHQVKPGGRILVTLSGWSFAFGMALLYVTGPGRLRDHRLDRGPTRPDRP